MTSHPTVTGIRRVPGIAGQYAYRFVTTYPGEEPQPGSFIHNTYGGPIFIVLPSGAQVIVADRVRARLAPHLNHRGLICPDWVRAFFGPENGQ